MLISNDVAGWYNAVPGIAWIKRNFFSGGIFEDGAASMSSFAPRPLYGSSIS